MAQSSDSTIVGVYGLLRGIIGVLVGIGFAAEFGAVDPVIELIGIGPNGLFADMPMIVGGLTLLLGIAVLVGGVGLLIEEGWGPIVSVAGFGLLALVGVIELAVGGVEIVLVVILLLDLLAFGWSVREAPEIPIGNRGQEIHAI